MDDLLTIGNVAKISGVNTQTIRYYERRQLLKPDFRKESGYRFYSSDAPKKIQFIKNAQQLGFTLSEILVLLKLQIRHKGHCGDVQKKTQAKLKDVRLKIDGLKSIEKVLGNLTKACQRKRKTEECPILKSLEDM